MTQRKIGVGALILGLVAALWIAFSPYWTASRMRAALLAKDGDALNAYIDYPALREDFKAQIAAKAAKEIAKGGPDAAGMTFAMAMMGPMVDSFVQPAMIKGMLAGQGDGPKGGLVGDEAHVKRLSLTRFMITDKSEAGGPVFEMRGLGWKMVGVTIPE